MSDQLDWRSEGRFLWTLFPAQLSEAVMEALASNEEAKLVKDRHFWRLLIISHHVMII